VRRGLPQVLDALALRAEGEGPQSVPPKLLRDTATALTDLAHIAAYGCPWCQRIAREGRSSAPSAAPSPGSTS